MCMHICLMAASGTCYTLFSNRTLKSAEEGQAFAASSCSPGTNELLLALMNSCFCHLCLSICREKQRAIADWSHTHWVSMFYEAYT